LLKGVPSHAIVPVWLGKDSELISLPEARILLTDFGESFQPSSTNSHHSHTPDLLIPPEVIFLPREPLSFPADIWTLAGTIWGILGQRPLFEGFGSDPDLVTKEKVDVLGKLPPEWWQKWTARSKWFDEDGVRHGGLGRFEYSIQEPRKEEGMEKLSDEEKADLFALLEHMMSFRPEDRPSADEVLNSRWVRERALPELEMMRDKP
jgi:serine/threonine protein kinase